MSETEQADMNKLAEIKKRNEAYSRDLVYDLCTHDCRWLIAELERVRKPICVQTEDILLPDLNLPNPCKIRIEVRDDQVFLYVGQRDWQWHIDGRWIGCGTALMP